MVSLLVVAEVILVLAIVFCYCNFIMGVVVGGCFGAGGGAVVRVAVGSVDVEVFIAGVAVVLLWLL